MSQLKKIKALQEAKEIEKRIDQRKKESLSGAAVTKDEADRLIKDSTAGAVGEAVGSAVTQKEADRLKKGISRSAVIGSTAEAMSADAMKNISGAGISDAERERLKDVMPDYADGGEVVFGKGKDYIKDLL